MTSHLTPTVQLGDRDVPLIRVGVSPAAGSDLASALAEAGLATGRLPVVVLVGGADGLVASNPAAWQALLREGLVAGVVRAGACVVDGGTESGVLALAGLARADAAADYPSIGVVAEGTVRWPPCRPSPSEAPEPTREPEIADAAEIGPHHTHIVSIPGDRWGDEPPWISRVASILAGPGPSVTVVMNGGSITLDDVRQSVAARRPVLLVEGTGRLADALAAALLEPAGAPPELRALARSRLLRVVAGMADPEQLADAIAAQLRVSAPPPA
jgi:hypothetical protein